MLRLVDDQDPIKELCAAYLAARENDPAFAESLRQALKLARQSLPTARRPYDLRRRLARALERFQGVRDVPATREAGKVVPLPARRLAVVLPDGPLKIGA